MSSFERFLDASHEEVLPYMGGASVDTRTRRLRVVASTAAVEPGWWRFTISGRVATAMAPADPVLDDLPVVRGHTTDGVVVVPPGVPRRLHLAPLEPPRFAAVVTRRWVTGELLFESLDFESGAEQSAREAFDDGTGLVGVRAVPATLRGTFAVAVLMRTAARRGTRVSPAEVGSDLLSISEEGELAAERVVQRLERERARERAGVDEVVERFRQATGAGRTMSSLQSSEDRVFSALDNTGAVLLDLRLAAPGLLEVRFRFMEGVFLAAVDASTLQVYDAGICLSGHDSELTLESLPSVIREAITQRRLVVTRW